MAKKTKQEKILAAYRKKLRLLNQSRSPIESGMTKERETPVPSPVITAKAGIRIPEETQEDATLKKYFLVDFKKSFIFIVTIIALEIGIYFARLIK